MIDMGLCCVWCGLSNQKFMSEHALDLEHQYYQTILLSFTRWETNFKLSLFLSTQMDLIYCIAQIHSP